MDNNQSLSWEEKYNNIVGGGETKPSSPPIWEEKYNEALNSVDTPSPSDAPKLLSAHEPVNNLRDIPVLKPAHKPANILKPVVHRFLEGAGYGTDYWKTPTDESIGLLGTIAEFGGEYGRFTLIAGATALAIGTLPVSLPSVVAGGFTMLGVSAFDQLFAPEEQKPGVKGTAFNVALGAGGGVGQSIAKQVLKRYIPKASPIAERLIFTVGDELGSTVAGMSFVEDKKQFFKEAGYELLGFGTLDLLMYGRRAGHLKLSKKANLHLDEAIKVFDDALETRSEVSKLEVMDHINEIAKEITPEQLDVVVKDYKENGAKEIIKKAEEPSPPQPKQPGEVITKHPSEQPDIKLQEETVRSPYTQLTVDEVAKLIEDETGNLSVERLEELSTVIKPSHGDAINTTRYNVDGQAQELMLQIAEHVKNREVETHSETKLKADQLTKKKMDEAKSLADLYDIKLKDAVALKQVLDEAPKIATHLRTVEAGYAAEAIRLAKLVTSEKNVSNVIRGQFVLTLSKLDETTKLITDIATGSGRTLSSFGATVDGDIVDFNSATARILKDTPEAEVELNSIITKYGGTESIKELANKLLKSKDIKGVMKESHKVNKQHNPYVRALFEYYQNSIFSSPNTLFANIGGNVINTLWENTTNLIASTITGPIDRFILRRSDESMSIREALKRNYETSVGLFSMFSRPIIPIWGPGGVKALQGKSTFQMLLDFLHPAGWEKILESTNVTMGKSQVEGVNTKALSFENFENRLPGKVVKGVTAPADYLIRQITKKTGKPIENTPILDLVRVATNETGSLYRTSFQGLELTDRPFTTGAYYAELKGLVTREANKRKLKGAERQTWEKHITDGVISYRRENRAITNFGSNIPESTLEYMKKWREKYNPAELKMIKDIDSSSVAYSDELTFKTPLSYSLGHIEKAFNRHPLGRIVLNVGAIRTPLNVFAKLGRSTPVLHFLSKKVVDDLNAGGVRRQKAQANLILASILYTVSWELAKNGLITPSASNPSERERMLEANIQERSIKIGDKWVEFNRLEPVANFLSLTADVYHAIYTQEYDKQEELIGALFAVGYKMVKEKSMLEGLSRTIDAVQYGKAVEYLEGQAEALKGFSGLRRYLAQTEGSPYYEEYYMEAQTLLEQIRGESKLPKLDSYGKKIDITDRFLGLKVTPIETSPVRKEAVHLDINLSLPDETITLEDGAKITLTDKQLNELRASLEDEWHIEARLNKLINDIPNWNKLPKSVRKDEILSLYNKIKTKAEEKYLKTHPELIQQIPDAKRKAYLEKIDNEPELDRKPWLKWMYEEEE